MDDILYGKLIGLRDKIKHDSFKNKIKKHSVTVCNDNVIESIVNLMPESIEDFKKIRGVGDTFIEKYAARFLDVVNEHIKTTYSYSRTNKKEIEILQKLSNKLVNINQKNRLLYAGRLTNKTAFDLCRLDDKKVEKIIESFINEDSKQYVIAKANYDKAKTSKLVDEFNAIKTLYRETEIVRVEKGQEILYLGYPYVEGKLFSDFKIKAPLFLFPAKIEVVNNEYRLMFDKKRDIVYNTNIILANNKFNNKNDIITNEVVEEISKENYLDNAISFFAQYHVFIEKKKVGLEEFVEHNNSTFPLYDNDNLLHLKGYCVLGAFATFSNAIQKDYNEIIENKVISKLVRDLFVGMDEVKTEIQVENTEVTSQEEIDEEQLFYINSLNYSQEKVLSEVEQKDAMVIQGPPGTGKSQTITSLIAQAVLQNKKVLVISEKKTALDVIYNRLGKIANLVLFIDDPNNKEEFYEQLLSLLELDDEIILNNDKIKERSQEINNELAKLTELESVLDSQTKLKASLRNLYIHSRKLNFHDQEIVRIFKEVNVRRTKTFTLEQLIRFRKTFKDEQLLGSLLTYKENLKYESIYELYKKDLKETEIFLSQKDFYEILFYVNLYNKFGFIMKFRLNGKNSELVKKMNELCVKLGGKQKKKVKNALYQDVNSFMSALEAYPKYNFNKNVYNSLKQNEKKYFEFCYHMSHKLNIDFRKINEYLIDIFTTIEIEEYENKHGDVLINTERFHDVRDKISSLSEEKESLTFELVYNTLQAKISSIFTEQSKRLNELKRKCENKRRWSITKLLKEFNLELFNSVFVWLLTPEGVSEIFPMKETLFDLIIFDEASQMFIENAVPILYRTTKAVIAGDSKQLRPSKFGLGRIDSEDIDYDEYSGVLEEESLLDLAKHRYHEVMLNYHYRSKYEELIAFSNYAFYDGKLHVCPNPEVVSTRPIERIKVNGRFVDRKNDVEADEIVRLLKKIFKERTNNESIGIITFNSTQKDLIMDKIEQECLYNAEFNNMIISEKIRKSDEVLFIKNIENVQGDERDIILFSIGYAPNEQNRIVRQFGWLNNDGGENRLNVAISRAKKKIYVVTSIEPNELYVDDLKNKGPKLLRNYLEYVKAVSERDQDTTQKILYSLNENVEVNLESEANVFEESVYNELVNMGFVVDRNVGTGVHKINLAIKDTINNKYLLGIELDSSNTMSSIKERDYHRQKYLELFGWKIHRIWCSDWWRDSQKEVNKVVSLMNHIIEK